MASQVLGTLGPARNWTTGPVLPILEGKTMHKMDGLGRRLWDSFNGLTQWVEDAPAGWYRVFRLMVALLLVLCFTLATVAPVR